MLYARDKIIKGLALAASAALGAWGYSFFVTAPLPTHTVEERTVYRDREVIKFVEKIVIQKQFVDREVVKTIVKKNGDTTTVVMRDRSKITTEDKVKVVEVEKVKEFEQVKTESNVRLTRYSLGLNWTLNKNLSYSYETYSVNGGIRMGNSPLFLTLDIRDKFKTYGVGLRYEF